MGNSSSSSGRGHQDETVDFGSLTPQGVYTGPKDWNQAIVSQLICQRKLAPFYRPLEEYDDSWDDEQILAARKGLPDASESGANETRIEVTASGLKSTHNKRLSSSKEPSKPEAAIYRGAVECPICFLYYPSNINRSRCCDQVICTECFVQIKRAEPTATHLVSEPAACPYCVQENFGVVYTPPPWRAGIGSEGSPFPWSDSPKGSPYPGESTASHPTHKRRQKSFGHDSPEVVTTDHIRPDWEVKLAAVRAAVARRANRRIIMRQVGDRLIPVGVTSGRVHPLNPEDGQTEGNNDNGGRRSRRRHQQQPQGFDQFLGSMGIGGQDLEELMIMEAMRLSLIEHEEQQRREAEEKKKREAVEAAQAASSGGMQSTSGPGPSASEARSNQDPSTSHLSPSSTPISTSSSLTPNTLSHDGASQPSSRSRTPSPSRTNPLHMVQSINDTSTAWRRRTSSPPPFSTLTAAVTAASTASAVLGSEEPEASFNTSASSDSCIGQNGVPIAGPIPTILVGGNSNSTASYEDRTANSYQQQNEPSTSSSPRSAESLVQFGSSHDPLPSSSDTNAGEESLLTGKMQPDGGMMAKASAAHSSGDCPRGAIGEQG